MLSALLWKEWRQLRLLRWTGVGIGFLLPPLALLVAESARQGWLPFGSVSAYSAAEVLGDAVPEVLAMLIWPLMALMLTAQAFAGDRAAGTESFLLERPVARKYVWHTRLIAAVGSTALVVVAHWLLWWLLMSAMGVDGQAAAVIFETSPNAVWSRLASSFGAGTVLTLTALFAGAAAAALAPTPSVGVLAGIVLTLTPFGLAGLFTGAFPWVRIADVHLAWIVPLLMLPGYGVCSYLVVCRGEPAGRGRYRRGAIALLVTLLVVGVSFAVAAPGIVRHDAADGLANTTFVPSPDSRLLIARNNYQGAGWILDTTGRSASRLLHPHVEAAAWNADGTRLAVVRSLSRFGRSPGHPQIELYDGAGARVGLARECDDCLIAWRGGSIVWIGDRLVIRTADGLLLTDDTGQRVGQIEIAARTRSWRLLGPTTSGEIFVLVSGARDDERGPQAAASPAALHRVDIAGERLEAPVTIESVGHIWYANVALSPSGRYWLRRGMREGESSAIVELATGVEQIVPGRRAQWLAGDRLAWIRRDVGRIELLVGRPGDARVVRTWPLANPLLQPSPDGRRLLVQLGVWDPGVHELAVYDVDSGRWSAPPGIVRPDLGTVQWAGESTLAVSGRGFLALQHLEEADGFDAVIGELPD